MTDFAQEKEQIRSKIAELAADLGRPDAKLADDEIIPQTGLLDSASLMMLVVWYEEEFGVDTEKEELTIDNFGSVDRMVDYMQRHK